jgi:hypothetical protein
MPNRFMVSMFGLVGLLAAALIVSSVDTSAQNNATKAWPEIDWRKPPITAQTRKPAPRRSLAGSWSSAGGPDAGTQAGGVQLKPNNGRPENALPYTPHALEVYKTHKPTEGIDIVAPNEHNDPRNFCEPLGFPRWNHYSNRFTQIFQDEHKIAILYHYDIRWRIIWIDGRPLPKLLDGGVEVDGQFREQRWMGYSVGRWLDDTTLEVQTVGTMPEDRVWLDNTGRPISDQVRVTETIRRLDYDTLEWSETINDPVMYTRPWDTLKMAYRLQDPRAEENENVCSPANYQLYLDAFGNSASESK